jgi:hypothetical protein
VGNFVEGDMDILRRDGDTLAKVGSFALPSSANAPMSTSAGRRYSSRTGRRDR